MSMHRFAFYLSMRIAAISIVLFIREKKLENIHMCAAHKVSENIVHVVYFGSIEIQ